MSVVTNTCSLSSGFNELTNNAIEQLLMNEIKDVMHYFSREDDSAIPARKTEIIERV